MPSSRRGFIQKLAMGTLGSIPIAGARSLFASTSESEKTLSNGPLRLDDNGNGYGPFDASIYAIEKSLKTLSAYPDEAHTALVETISARLKVERAQLVLGCGSSEILRAAANGFLGPGKKLLTARPTFPAIGEYAKALGSTIVTVPLNKYFEHDLSAMAAKVDAATRLIYICTPNNPTGTLTPRPALDRFLGSLPESIPVIVDEAYNEYVEPSQAYASFIARPVNHGRVIVLRTFSKMYGLAGLRVGYAVTNPDDGVRIQKQLTHNGVNALGAEAARAALLDGPALKQSFQRNIDAIQEFVNEATGRRLKPLVSHAHFVTLDTTVAPAAVVLHISKNNI